MESELETTEHLGSHYVVTGSGQLQIQSSVRRMDILAQIPIFCSYKFA